LKGKLILHKNNHIFGFIYCKDEFQNFFFDLAVMPEDKLFHI